MYLHFSSLSLRSTWFFFSNFLVFCFSRFVCSSSSFPFCCPLVFFMFPFSSLLCFFHLEAKEGSEGKEKKLKGKDRNKKHENKEKRAHNTIQQGISKIFLCVCSGGNKATTTTKTTTKKNNNNNNNKQQQQQQTTTKTTTPTTPTMTTTTREQQKQQHKEQPSKSGTSKFTWPFLAKTGRS